MMSGGSYGTTCGMSTSVLAASLVTFCTCFASSGYVPLAPFVVGSDHVGLLLLTQGLASCAALVPSGRAVDKQGAEPVLKQGMGVMVVGLVLTGLTPSVYVQLAGRIFVGTAGSIMFNAGMALLMEHFQEPERARHLGTAMGIGTTGNLAGPPMAGYIFELAARRGLPQPQGLAFLPSAVLLLYAYIVLLRMKKADISAVPPVPLIRETSDGKSPMERFFGVYAAVGLKSWVLAAALACHFGTMSALLCAGVLQLHHAGCTAVMCGLAPVPAGLLQVLISPVGGKLSSTPWARGVLMFACPLALTLGLVGVTLASSLASPLLAYAPIYFIAGAMAVSSATNAAIDAPSMSLMADLAALHGCGHGAAVTASEFAVTVGQAVGPLAGAVLLRWIGYDGLCYALAATAAVVSAACAATLRHAPHEEAA